MFYVKYDNTEARKKHIFELEVGGEERKKEERERRERRSKGRRRREGRREKGREREHNQNTI